MKYKCYHSNIKRETMFAYKDMDRKYEKADEWLSIS